MTMNTCTPGPAQDICPTEADILPQLLAMLPRGRAWGNNDGAQTSGVRIGFWTVVAHLLAYINRRICDLREEFFCATAKETLDVWDAEYGLPDNCEPFPNLCAKVAALGGTICSYYQQICAASGWTIQCFTADNACGARFGGARFGANVGAVASTISRFGSSRFSQKIGCGALAGSSGAPRFGAMEACALMIIVITRSSPSYTPPTSYLPRFAQWRFGQRLGCGEPNILGVQCLIERIAPAHAVIKYEVQ
jgi:uncharacterized protein YmfQ (DUF2313 family)